MVAYCCRGSSFAYATKTRRPVNVGIDPGRCLAVSRSGKVFVSAAWVITVFEDVNFPQWYVMQALATPVAMCVDAFDTLVVAMDKRIGFIPHNKRFMDKDEVVPTEHTAHTIQCLRDGRLVVLEAGTGRVSIIGRDGSAHRTVLDTNAGAMRLDDAERIVWSGANERAIRLCTLDGEQLVCHTVEHIPESIAVLEHGIVAYCVEPIRALAKTTEVFRIYTHKTFRVFVGQSEALEVRPNEQSAELVDRIKMLEDLPAGANVALDRGRALALTPFVSVFADGLRDGCRLATCAKVVAVSISFPDERLEVVWFDPAAGVAQLRNYVYETTGIWPRSQLICTSECVLDESKTIGEIAGADRFVYVTLMDLSNLRFELAGVQIRKMSVTREMSVDCVLTKVAHLFNLSHVELYSGWKKLEGGERPFCHALADACVRRGDAILAVPPRHLINLSVRDGMRTHSVRVMSDAKVSELKASLEVLSAIPRDKQRIMFRDLDIHDRDCSLSVCKICNGSVLKLEKKHDPAHPFGDLDYRIHGLGGFSFGGK